MTKIEYKVCYLCSQKHDKNYGSYLTTLGVWICGDCLGEHAERELKQLIKAKILKREQGEVDIEKMQFTLD
jgi:predicted metal-binding protein